MGKNGREKKNPHFFVFLLFYPHLSKTSKFWLLILPWFVLSLLLECHRNNLGPGFLFISINKISLLDLPCFAVAPREYSLLWNRTRSSTRHLFDDGPLLSVLRRFITTSGLQAWLPRCLFVWTLLISPFSLCNLHPFTDEIAPISCTHTCSLVLWLCALAEGLVWPPHLSSPVLTHHLRTTQATVPSPTGSPTPHPPPPAKRLLSVVPEQGMPTIYL